MSAEVQDNHYTLALPSGALLAERYRLVRQLGGSSAFAITYLAEDVAGSAVAVVKEFFPRAFVGRGADGTSVRPHSPEDERDFVRALRRFVNEGASLAEITHPNLLRARRLAEANGTAYLIMDWHQATPLRDVVRGSGGRLAPADAGSMVQRLLSALEPLHADGVIHRDISPQSVHVLRDGQPILLGFTARRHVATPSSDLAAGFAAFEQYGTREVGPWTDVYALAALLYFLLTGNPPPSALERATGDMLTSPSAVIPELSPSVALAVLRGLALLPQQRPHSASEFRRQLESAFGENGGVVTSRGAASKQPFDVASAMADAAADEGASRGTALKLAAGGIVLPHEEPTAARMLRRLAGFAARFRRTSDRGAQPVPEDFETLEAPRHAAPPRTLVPQERPATQAPVVEAPQPPVIEAPQPAVVEAPQPRVVAAQPIVEKSPPVAASTAPAVVEAPQPVVEAPPTLATEVPRSPEPVVDRHPTPASPNVDRPAPNRSRRVRFAPESQRAVKQAADAARSPRDAAATAASSDVAAELELAREKEAAETERRGRQRRFAAAAAILLIAGAGVTALVVRGGLRAQDVRTDTPVTRASAEAATTTPGVSTPTHVGVAGGALQQSASAPDPSRATSPATDSAATAPRTAPPSRPASSTPATEPAPAPATRPATSPSSPNVPSFSSLNAAISTAASEVKMVPPELLVDVRGRLSSGEDQSEQGEYLAARRIFRAALQHIDSATARYPSSQALRALRRDVEQADQNALRACIAENEMHRKRGEQPGSCQ